MPDKTRADAGFTLIEVLLAIVIGALVITSAIELYSQGQTMYTRAQNRVDSQSQLRLTLNHIKRELSVATNVQITGTLPETFEADFCYFYVQNDTFVLQEGTGSPEALPGCVALPGLWVTYEQSPLADNMIRVYMTCADGAELESDILVQNTAADVGNTSGNVVVFERLN